MTPSQLDATRRNIKAMVCDPNLFTPEERTEYFKRSMTTNTAAMAALYEEVRNLEQARWKEFKKQPNFVLA